MSKYPAVVRSVNYRFLNFSLNIQILVLEGFTTIMHDVKHNINAVITDSFKNVYIHQSHQNY